MDSQLLNLRPPKYDLIFGYGCLVAAVVSFYFALTSTFILLIYTLPSAFGAWWYLRMRKELYKNRLSLRYLNTLHGSRWKWGEGYEGITKYFGTNTGIDPKYSDDKKNEKLNLQDVEAYRLSRFIDRLRQGSEQIDITTLSEMQRSDLAFDLQVLGTEYQRQAEKIKRITEDSALATQYQHIALYCQKEARRIEGSGLVAVANEVTASEVTSTQGLVEELKSTGGMVRLMQQEGRVTELRFYGLPPGEYTLTIKRQTKVIKTDDGAATVSFSELGVSPQPHGAFMIDAPNGETDAVQW